MTARHDQGSQSKPAVLAAALFMALMSLSSLYLICDGPSQDSVFFLFRSGFFFYPLMLIASGLFGCFAWLGVKRFKALQALDDSRP